MLAVGSHDDSIYVYRISDRGDYTLHWAINFVHSSAITAMDWSRDSQFLRAIDQAYSKIYYDVDSAQQIPDGASTLTDPAMW